MLLAKRFHQNHQAVLAAVSINGLIGSINGLNRVGMLVLAGRRVNCQSCLDLEEGSTEGRGGPC